MLIGFASLFKDDEDVRICGMKLTKSKYVVSSVYSEKDFKDNNDNDKKVNLDNVKKNK